MTGWILSRVAMAATVAAILTVQANGAEDAGGRRGSENRAGAIHHRDQARDRREGLEDRKLALVEDGQVKKVYTVAVGKPSTPSPVGAYTIARRVAEIRRTRTMARLCRQGRVIPWARGGWG